MVGKWCLLQTGLFTDWGKHMEHQDKNSAMCGTWQTVSGQEFRGGSSQGELWRK